MMKKIMKRIKLGKFIAVAVAMALAAVAVPMADAEAKGETWSHPGDGWHYLEGTDISVQIDGDAIRIRGTGAIPDYDPWSLDERPWGKTTCQSLFIDDTITSVGSYAFYNMQYLKHISISTKTFISNTRAFENTAYFPVFRLRGEEETVKMIGTIPFTSYDSIKRMAQSTSKGAVYILDTQKAARGFQTSTNPTIANVYYAGDAAAPWNNLSENVNGAVKTDFCKIATPVASNFYGVSAQRLYQGDACYEAYAAFIGGYTFAMTFNMTLMSGKKVIDHTDSALQYTLSIPDKYIFPGRSFRLLAIGNGVVNIYDDMDTADATVTFATNEPTTSYALVYR